MAAKVARSAFADLQTDLGRVTATATIHRVENWGCKVKVQRWGQMGTDGMFILQKTTHHSD
jgi:hypothetical protein